MFCGLPVGVATEPRFEAVASAIRYGDRPHAQGQGHLQDQRSEGQAHGVVDEERGEEARHRDEAGQELARRPRAARHRDPRPAKEPGQPEVGDHDHHPEQEHEGVEVDHAEGVLRA